MDNNSPNSIAAYVTALKNSDRLGDQVVYHRVLEECQSNHAPNTRPWPKAVQDILANADIDQLYAHQALATDIIRSGRDVVVATPTASGKSFIYNLPVIERFLADPESRAMYLFPLKALAQDQFKTFASLTESWPKEACPQAGIYDGDTTAWFRKKIRNSPPNVLFTNPEMVHLSICPHHEKWVEFLAGLSFIVVDEVHTYRGVLGSHMAQVFRRLLRVCARYGQRPTFIFCSATVGNPAELAQQLTGLEHVETVAQSGAPQGKRHFVFINPLEGAAQAAILLLQAALHRGLRTIVYAQSRKMTELISLWAGQRSGKYKDKISAYRAGFLPEERREIEAKMSSGELLAVISTSALELGIDIGALDLCILVGYPGSVMATLQRGGRVGRSTRESAVALIAHEDALDQYYMRNPSDFFERPPECAVLNPHNPVILARHLECAAAEMPLKDGEPWLRDPKTAAQAAAMEATGKLLRSADGVEFYTTRKQPQRDISLRGSGATYQIEATSGTGEHVSGVAIGTIDEHRAFKETHEGAIYLHKGESYVVDALDLPGKTVRVGKRRVDYFTRPRGNKVTEIIEQQAGKTVWGTTMYLGRLKVTETITGYEKRRIRGNKLLNIIPLDLPPLVFETQGLWFTIPIDVQRKAEAAYMHFMGGIHALEHAAIGITPLLVLTDRNDLGGISTPMHPQVGLPAVFVYDGMPGGVGLAAQAFERAEEFFLRTLHAIRSCPCELGCPSCVHSPKCGSGNRPIDKAAALFIIKQIQHNTGTDATPELLPTPEPKEDIPMPEDSTKPTRYAVLDVETQLSAQEVGGWNKANKMRVSVAVLYDSQKNAYTTYHEQDVPKMLEFLEEFDLVIGFNILRFDYSVLSAYTAKNLKKLPTLDLLEHIRTRLGYRLSLDHLAQRTLGAEKSADGLQALAWWKEGRVDEIAEYCQKDVKITKELYELGKEHKHVLFQNKAKKIVRAPVDW